MTEREAHRLLAEHRDPPSFYRGRRLFRVMRDGHVDIYRLSRNGDRAVFDLTVQADSYALPPEVRNAARVYSERTEAR